MENINCTLDINKISKWDYMATWIDEHLNDLMSDDAHITINNRAVSCTHSCDGWYHIGIAKTGISDLDKGYYLDAEIYQTYNSDPTKAFVRFYSKSGAHKVYPLTISTQD